MYFMLILIVICAVRARAPENRWRGAIVRYDDDDDDDNDDTVW